MLNKANNEEYFPVPNSPSPECLYACRHGRQSIDPLDHSIPYANTKRNSHEHPDIYLHSVTRYTFRDIHRNTTA